MQRSKPMLRILIFLCLALAGCKDEADEVSKLSLFEKALASLEFHIKHSAWDSEKKDRVRTFLKLEKQEMEERPYLFECRFNRTPVDFKRPESPTDFFGIEFFCAGAKPSGVIIKTKDGNENRFDIFKDNADEFLPKVDNPLFGMLFPTNGKLYFGGANLPGEATDLEKFSESYKKLKEFVYTNNCSNLDAAQMSVVDQNNNASEFILVEINDQRNSKE